MAQSILVAPPKGSVLASRVAGFREGGYGSDLPDDIEPVLRAIFEAGLVEDDPREWKHPPDRIARVVLIPNVRLAFGEEAAAALERHPDMAADYAANFQAARKAKATAPEKAREPKPDTPVLATAIVMAEFLRVLEAFPDESMNRRFELTGQHLGGPGAPIDRNTIRRIVCRELPKIAVLSDDPEKLKRARILLSTFEHLPELMRWPPLRKVG